MKHWYELTTSAFHVGRSLRCTKAIENPWWRWWPLLLAQVYSRSVTNRAREWCDGATTDATHRCTNVQHWLKMAAISIRLGYLDIFNITVLEFTWKPGYRVYRETSICVTGCTDGSATQQAIVKGRIHSKGIRNSGSAVSVNRERSRCICIEHSRVSHQPCAGGPKLWVRNPFMETIGGQDITRQC